MELSDIAAALESKDEKLDVDIEPVANEPVPDDPLFEKLLQSSNVATTLHALTGFTLSEFLDLYDICRSSLEHGGRGRKPKHGSRDKLFLAFSYLKHYPKFEYMAALYSMSLSNIKDIITSTLEKIHCALKNQFLVPIRHDELQSFGAVLREFPHVVAMVDTTSQPTQTPGGCFSVGKSYFSGKHYRYVIKTEVLHAPNGTAMFVSSGHKGSEHDLTIFAKSRKTYALYLQGRAVMADKGYSGAQELEGIVVEIPAKEGNLTEEEVRRNTLISRHRVVIENYYGRLKSSFAIMRHEFRGDLAGYPKLFELCASLTNYMIRGRPLRAQDDLDHTAWESRIIRAAIQRSERKRHRLIAAANRRRQRLQRN